MHACMYASYAVLEASMDGCMLYTGVGSTLWAWYACMLEAGTPVHIYVPGMLLPFSARLCFICSSAARRWCSSVCPLCCWLPVTRARVEPLLVLDCLPAALIVARACPTVARAPMIARRSQLHVYPLLNVRAYCSFSHALASGVAVA